MTYKANVNRMKDMDMRMFGHMVAVEENDEWFLTDCESAEDYENVDWGNTEYDEYEARDCMKMLIKEAPHYLVVAHNVRWDGCSGYKFSHDLLDAIHRDYDSVIYPESVSRGGKTLVCREASHDVPMGAMTTIIALTENEYDRLCRGDGVWDFAEKMEERAISIA